MEFNEKIDTAIKELMTGTNANTPQMRRICGEIDFARRFMDIKPEMNASWTPAIMSAVEIAQKSVDASNLERLACEVEDVLAPIGETAKTYTMYLTSHAHIDMNWTWPWIETIAISRDTFETTSKMMDEFPDLVFAQSQISIYAAMKKYVPEVFDMIKKRMAEGRWESTATKWVESDENMASGESICRHLLYSKLWMKENMDLPLDALKLVWEGDTFGHPWTLPAILNKGGITRYYHCRPTMPHWLARWRSQDGSEVLEFCDKGWYNGDATPSSVSANFVDYTRETGLHDFLWIVGVGDHGGGPTREYLKMFKEMEGWTIYPRMQWGTTDDFFTTLEKNIDQIRVFDNELNSVFEGCYTSQSKVKQINRIAENILPEAETISLLANMYADLPYPGASLRDAWQNMLFNQFHDILSGSSGHEAMEESVARFREAEALSGTIKIRALREIASKIDTASFALDSASDEPYADVIGHGGGEIRIPGRTSTMSMGMPGLEPIVVFNQLPFTRSGMVTTKVWDRNWSADSIVVRDDQGNEVPVQVVGASHYAHYQHALNLIFPAMDIPSMGYRTYSVQPSDKPTQVQGASLDGSIIENEYLKVEVDGASGAICHLIDKMTGFDYVPEGGLMGLLELYQEAPHIMTAWDIGQITGKKVFDKGGHPVEITDMRYINEGDSLGMVFSRKAAEAGPHRASIRTMHEKGDTWVVIEVSLSAGSKSVEVNVTTDWREIGTPKTGVPMLKMAFNTNISNPKATYEIPFGSISRPTNGAEVCSLRWADLSGDNSGSICGITLLNDCKYGFSADENTLRVTVIRSSYDPDPAPEVGFHQINFSIVPHEGRCDVSESMRKAASFNLPMAPVGTTIHAGTLPVSGSSGEILSPNIHLASFKKAECSDAAIIRLYEVEGKDTMACVKLPECLLSGASASEVDILEQKLSVSSAKIEGDMLTVQIPAYGIVSVMIG